MMLFHQLVRNFVLASIASGLVVPAFCAPAPKATAPVAAEAAIPEEVTPWPIVRYEKMIRKSPFAPATAAPVVAATPGFAANLYLSGLAKIGDRDFVSISSRDQSTKFSLFAGETSSQDGIQLVSVQWADGIGKSKVTVKKGTEFGVLEYDQALLQKVVQVSQPTMQPGMAQPPQMPRPIVIPRPGQPVQPGQFDNAQPAIPTRRRSIIRAQQP